jgi:hypothetical protein
MESKHEPIDENEIYDRIKNISLWEWNIFLQRIAIAIRKFDLDSFTSIYNDFRIAVAFDWSQWEEGLEFIEKDFPDFYNKDIIFCLKILTTIIRKNRIDDGILKSRILDGFMSQLIKRIDELINNPDEDHFDYEDMMDELFNHGKEWKHRNLRTVLNVDSTDFFDTNWYEKKVILHRLLNETNFLAVIQQYKQDYLDVTNPKEINSLEKTLLKYLKAILTI